MGRPSKYKEDAPSVTEIVDILDKPSLRYWYGKYGTAYCERVKKESQVIGHGVHDGIEKYLNGKSFSKASSKLNDKQKLMLSRLVEWVEEKKVKLVSTEESLYSKKYNFNGTYDCLGKIDNEPWIIDWKTDSTPSSSDARLERTFKYALQTAGYSLLINENRLDLSVHKAVVIRISKKQEFAEYFFHDLSMYEVMFLQLRNIYRELKGK